MRASRSALPSPLRHLFGVGLMHHAIWCPCPAASQCGDSIDEPAGVSWTVFGKAIIGWVFTLIIVGLISALLMALGIFTPNLRSAQAMSNVRDTVAETAPWIAGNATAACPNTPVRHKLAFRGLATCA